MKRQMQVTLLFRKRQKNVLFRKKKTNAWDGEVAKWLGAYTTLVELSLIFRICVQLYVTTTLEDPMHLSSVGPCIRMHTPTPRYTCIHII